MRLGLLVREEGSLLGAFMQRIDGWWQSNRPSSPQLFDREAKAAIDRLCFQPFSGTRHKKTADGMIYRTVLKATQHHLYYMVDAAGILVVVVSGAPKEHPPRF